MVILGFALIFGGALVIAASVFTAQLTDGRVELIGVEVTPISLFLLGVGAGVAILWGFTILKYGARRSLRQRRDQKKLEELSEKLDRVDRRNDGDRGEQERDTVV
ncbi:MAG: hypothetical protein F2667_11920 [Actinobacteria bacterium]|uniref:Unannotated protein n=1 Tax=freshwater metagenome TaxID=449393 RepID=A0A6J6RT17_9ZZZZ|nr:hypothetical protein [Actinomycetota bacterium]